MLLSNPKKGPDKTIWVAVKIGLGFRVWGYIGIMEKKMETTIMGYIPASF